MTDRVNNCANCGTKFETKARPRQCNGCSEITWFNPTPVVVAIQPVETPSKVLMVRRSIEPKKGTLALPGGYLDSGETWQDGAARELWEETGLRVDPANAGLFDVHSALDTDTVIVFCSFPLISEMPKFKPNSEVSEIVLATDIEGVEFQKHILVLKRWFHEAMLYNATRDMIESV